MNVFNSIQAALILKPQESGGGYKFNGQVVMTKSFVMEFGDLAEEIAINALIKVIIKRANSPEGADYLQVLSYEGTIFWIIDDVSVVTILLPEDY
ncbi:hypothetical protein [Ruminiclostridium cellobioparum]|uniref:hypothetical protein n=1 Tax=Ruminiclostridium cellobioparum TaxID=29355 RepID=UPI0028A62558|nr:hypothetical protein [Ruminiclostridium cellobioparum]